MAATLLGDRLRTALSRDLTCDRLVPAHEPLIARVEMSAGADRHHVICD
jgi:hypothetical protein